jgi:hypothetical protein
MKINQKKINTKYSLEGTIEIAITTQGNNEYMTEIRLDGNSNKYFVYAPLRLDRGEKVRLYLPYKESLNAIALEVLNKKGNSNFIYANRGLKISDALKK